MENKSKLNTFLLVIIITLLGVGLTYIFLNNNSKQKVGDNSSLNYPQDNQNTINQVPVTQNSTSQTTTQTTANQNTSGTQTGINTSTQQTNINNNQQPQSVVYKNEKNINAPVSFSYPSTWTVKNQVIDKYGMIGYYMIQPNTTNTNDLITINMQNGCLDDPNGTGYAGYTKIYIFNPVNPSDGMFITAQQIQTKDSNVMNFDDPKVRSCISIYTKSNNQNVLSEFVKIVNSLRVN